MYKLVNEEIAKGLKVESLKILKDNAKEVKKGLECGIVLEDFEELKKNDIPFLERDIFLYMHQPMQNSLF